MALETSKLSDQDNSNAAIVRSFIQAWSRLNVDELVAYFTEDGIYYNIPSKPIQGTAALKAHIGGFIGPWTETDWEIVSLISEGDLVAVERLDKTRAGDKQVDLPCFGMFEMSNGKIKVWRDYFDLSTYIRAMA